MAADQITVGSLGWCFCFFMAFLVAWNLWGSRFLGSWRNWAFQKPKNSRGFISLRTSLIFAACVGFSLILGAQRYKVHQLFDVYVINYDSDYHYHLRAPIKQFDGSMKVTDFWTTFCHDYEPLFSTGQTLKVLTYEDAGACWSIANTHPAYLIERDQNGNPTLH